MKKWKQITALLFSLVMILGLAGCSFNPSHLLSGSEDSAKNHLYYLNSNSDQIIAVDYSFGAADPAEQAMELVGMQSQDPLESGLRHLLPDGVTIDECTLDGTQLHIDLSSPLSDHVSTGKMLIVGGLVRTFIQIDGVDSVQITEAGSPLCDSDGKELGSLTLDDFIENAGKSINNYLYTTMTLYFADSTGTHLVAEQRRVYYSSNEPMERAVIEALIQGPTTEGLYAALPGDATVLSTHISGASSSGSSTDDGSGNDGKSGRDSSKVCYVSFDKNIQNTVSNVSEEVSLYSIVDSLVDTCGVDRVQFSINGENDTVFRSRISLSQQFEKKNI